VFGIWETVPERRRWLRGIWTRKVGQSQVLHRIQSGECFRSGSFGLKRDVHGIVAAVNDPKDQSRDNHKCSKQKQIATTNVSTSHMFVNGIFQCAVLATKVTELNLRGRLTHRLATQETVGLAVVAAVSAISLITTRRRKILVRRQIRRVGGWKFHVFVVVNCTVLHVDYWLNTVREKGA